MTAFPDQPWSRRPETTDSETADGEATDTSATGADTPAEPPRRRMTPLSPGAPAEPLIYQTQQRVPGEPGSFRPRRPQPERVEDDPLPPTQALPAQDAPQYRRRDFSPEGRRAVPSWAPAYAQADGGYPSSERLDYTTLGHQEVRAAVERSRAAQDDDGGAAEPPATEAPASGAVPMSTPEQPLTRRQLRALREAQEREERGEEAEDATTGEAAETDTPAEAAPEDDRPSARPWPSVFYTDETEQTAAEEVVVEEAAADPAAPATFAVPVQQPAVDEPSVADGAPRADETLDDWVAKVFDGTGEVPVSDAPALVEPPEPAHWDPDAGSDQAGSPAVFDALFTPPSQAEPESSDAAVDPAHPAASDPSDPLAFLGAQPSPNDRVDLPAPPAWGATPPAPEDAADPTAEEIVVEETAASEAPAEPTADEVHPVVVDIHPLPAEPIDRTPSGEVPTGHWTQQAAAPDDDALTLSRDVAGGHGVVTTNALVLPSIPQQELAGPLTNTGEILVTGSIDVPRSLSSTGAHPTQLDETRLDHELDFGDQQVVSADSQPIRAIKAVSTHTSTRGMMLTQKPRGNRSLTVLIIVTGALAIGVGVVLVVGLLNNAF